MNPVEWLEYEVFHETLLAWGTALAVFVGAWLALAIVHRMVRGRLRALAERHGLMAVQIAARTAQRTTGWFLFLVAVLLGSRFLVLTPWLHDAIGKAAALALLVQLGLWATAAFVTFMQLRQERQVAIDPSTVAAMDVLGFVLRLAVWSLVFLLALDNLGVNITALIAGLGVGGVAVALATQNILGDLFASLSIMLDKPFVGGDFLDVNGYLGSVEKIGIKTTRLRSLSGEQLVFSNNDLLNSRIRNFGRMFERRVVFSINVTYQTPLEKLKRIPEMLREAVEAQQNVRFDRAHFQKYGDFALVFEVVYYVTSADFTLYMDIQQNINLIIYERFAAERITFAHPTQVLYVTQRKEEPAAGAA
jgi:small-conductance mechanosensitive channel